MAPAGLGVANDLVFLRQVPVHQKAVRHPETQHLLKYIDGCFMVSEFALRQSQIQVWRRRIGIDFYSLEKHLDRFIRAVLDEFRRGATIRNDNIPASVRFSS